MTHGQRAQPFIKPAVADHAQKYRDIVKSQVPHGESRGLVEIQARLDYPKRFERYVKRECIVTGGRLL